MSNPLKLLTPVISAPLQQGGKYRRETLPEACVPANLEHAEWKKQKVKETNDSQKLSSDNYM